MKQPLSPFTQNANIIFTQKTNMLTVHVIHIDTVMIIQSNIFFLRDGYVCRTKYFLLDKDDIIHFNIESTYHYQDEIASLANIFLSKQRGLGGW